MRRLVLLALVAVLLPATAWSDPPAEPEPGLALKWPLDEVSGSTANGTVFDTSGNGLGGHVTGVDILASGRFGAALTVKGGNLSSSSGFPPVGIDRAATASLQPAQVTVLAWVRGSQPGSDAVLVTQGTDSSCGGGAYALRNLGGQLTFAVRHEASTATVFSDASAGVWNGAWHAVAGVYDGTRVRLYVDGVQVGAGTPLTTALDYASNFGGFRVGSANEGSCGSATQFHGDVDEVRVYDHALTAAELAYLQNPAATAPPKLPVQSATPTPTATAEPTVTGTPVPTPTAEPEPDLAVKWHLDQAADYPGQPYDDKVFDASGNARHGTVVAGNFTGDGRFGNAFALPQSPTGLVGVTTPGSAQLQPAAITALLWIRGTSPAEGAVVTEYGPDACAAGAYGFAVNRGELYFYVDAGGELGRVVSPRLNVFDGQWHAVAGTYDGARLHLFVDESEAFAPGFGAPGQITYQPNSVLRVGGPNKVCPGAGAPFQGDVDELRVYRRVLTGTEIGYLQAGSHRAPPRLPIPTGPKNTNRPQLTGVPKVGETMHCNPGTWTGNPNRFEYLWERAPRATTVDGDSAWAPINGATGRDYQLKAPDTSSRIRCREIAFAGTSSGEALSTSLRVDVDVPAPAGAVVMRTEDPAVVGPRTTKPLVCEPGAWTNGPESFEFSFRWFRDGVVIAGATERRYTPRIRRINDLQEDATGDGNHDLSCGVIARNDVGASAEAVSAARFVVDGPPQLEINGAGPRAVLNHSADGSANPLQQVFECQPGRWSDAYSDHPDTAPAGYGYAYQWYRRNSSDPQSAAVPIPGATMRGFQITAEQLGRVLSCRVTVGNPFGETTARSNETFIELPVPTKRGFIQTAFRDNPNDPVNLMALDYEYRDYAAEFARANLDRQRSAVYQACVRGQAQLQAQLDSESDPTKAARLKRLLIRPLQPTKNLVGSVISARETCWVLIKDFAHTQATPVGVQWDPPDRDCVIGSDPKPCVDLDIALQPVSAGQTSGSLTEQSFLAKARAIAPLRVLWDIDGDNRTDIVCPGTSPVVRGIFDPGEYNARAVIVDNASVATGLFSGGQVRLRFPNDASRNLGKLRRPQPLWCRSSITPPPDPKVGPCATNAVIGRVTVVGNLCPINVRAVPSNQLEGLPAKMREVIKVAADAINALEADREKLLPGYNPGLKQTLLDGAFPRAAVGDPFTQLNATLNNVAASVAGAGAVEAQKAQKTQTAREAKLQEAMSGSDAPPVNDKQQRALDQIYAAKTQAKQAAAAGTTDLTTEGGDVQVNGVVIHPDADQVTLIAPSDAGSGITGLDTPQMEIYSAEATTSLGGVPLQSDSKPRAFDAKVSEDAGANKDPYLQTGINWDTTDAAVARKLALGPFRLVGNGTSVRLNADGTATVDAVAELPGITNAMSDPGSGAKKGQPIRTPISLSGDPNGVLKLNDVRLAVKRAYLRGLPLKNLELTYNAQRGLTVTGLLAFDISGEEGIRLENFRLDAQGEFAGTDLFYDAGAGRGLPTAPGVWLRRLGGGFRTDPFEINAGAAIEVGPRVGSCPVVRADGGVNYHLSPPPLKLGLDGKVELVCLPIGGFHLEVDSTGWVKGSAHYDLSVADLFSLRADVSGELRAAEVKTDATGRLLSDRPLPYSLSLSGKADFNDIPLPDIGFSGVVGSRGIAACASIRIKPLFFPSFRIAAGAAVKFVDGRPPVNNLELLANFRAFIGCDLGAYRATPTRRTTRQAGAPQTFTLPAGPHALSFEGAGAAPRVRLTSPDGQTYDFTDATHGKLLDDAFGAIVEPEDRTVAMLAAKAGTWRAEVAPGSTPIVRVQVADILDAPSVKARVTGRGAVRVLAYDIKRIPGQEVVFVERAEGGYKVIGKVMGGGKGKLRFGLGETRSPKRTVTAQVTQDGLPRAQIDVAGYVAANPKLAAPKARVRRGGGGKALVTWRRVPGAARYDVAAAFGDGRRLLFAPAGSEPAVTIPGVGAKGGLTVRVTAYTLGGRQSSATAKLRKAKAKAKPRAKRKHKSRKERG